MATHSSVYAILDGNSLLHRSYHALPKTFKTKGGVLINAVYGFASMLLNIIARFHPEYLAVAFDKKGPTFRHKEFADYKAHRVKAPDELYEQIPIIKEMLAVWGIQIFEESGWEADDMIASFTAKMMKEHKKIMIFSSDLDLWQLLNDEVNLVNFQKSGQDFFICNPEEIRKRFNLTPEQITDFKGLKGDPSDNIKGVPGIGEKTALKLLQEYGSLENIYNNLGAIQGGVKKKLIAGKDSAFFSKKLATLMKEVEIKIDPDKGNLEKMDFKKIKEFFEKHNFKSLIKRLESLLPEDKKKQEETQQSLF